MVIHNYSDAEQKQIFSENLKRYIDMSGKTQQNIAADLDINAPTFNQWVTGKTLPSVSMIWHLADYFGVTLTDLVDRNTNDITKIEDKGAEDENDRAYRDYLIEMEFQNDAILIEINKMTAGMDERSKKRLLEYAKFICQEKEKR